MFRTLPPALLFAFNALFGFQVATANFVVTTCLQAEFRKWQDASGKFEIEAKLLTVAGDDVSLERPDGKKISIPLSKLSQRDRDFVESQNSLADPNNPFQEVESDGIQEWTVNWSDCPETQLDIGNWNPKIETQTSQLNIKPTALPGKADFFEGIAGMAVNAVAKRAVIAYHIAPPGKPIKSRLVLADIELGKTLGSAVGDGKWNVLAIHDDGQRIVVRNEGEDSPGQLGTVKLVKNTIKPIDVWTPYQSLEGKPESRVVRFAAFLNGGRLVTVNRNGAVVIWDFDSRNPLRRFDYRSEAQPALTTDRKYLGFAGGDRLGFVNLDNEEELPSVRSAPGMNFWIDTCFSPSCRRFAAANLSKLMVWDVDSGDVLLDGDVPGIQTTGQLSFPDEQFVMINGNKLIEISTRIKLWEYQGFSRWYDSKMLMIAHEDKSGKLMEVRLPHPKALEVLKQAKSQSDLFVLRKGAPVSIDLSGVPQQFQTNVEQSLKRKFETSGLRFQQGAPLVFKATIGGPSREAISYRFLGDFSINKYSCNLSIVYGNQVLWTGPNGSNVPGSLSAETYEEARKQLDEAGRGPWLGYFNTTVLPEFLQKPMGGTTNGAQNRQMIGSSKFTSSGLVDQ